MSLLTASSMESRWRGYEYFKNKKVSNLEHPENMRFHAVVSGSEKEPYTVTIDLEHLRNSSCTAPSKSTKSNFRSVEVSSSTSTENRA